MFFERFAQVRERDRLIHRAILLEAGIIAYNLLEGFLAIGAGVIAGSVALDGFGFDSAIEGAPRSRYWSTFGAIVTKRALPGSGASLYTSASL